MEFARPHSPRVPVYQLHTISFSRTTCQYGLNLSSGQLHFLALAGRDFSEDLLQERGPYRGMRVCGARIVRGIPHRYANQLPEQVEAAIMAAKRSRTHTEGTSLSSGYVLGTICYLCVRSGQWEAWYAR